MQIKAVNQQTTSSQQNAIATTSSSLIPSLSLELMSSLAMVVKHPDHPPKPKPKTLATCKLSYNNHKKG